MNLRNKIGTLIFFGLASLPAAFATTTALPIGGALNPPPSNGSTPTGTLDATTSGTFSAPGAFSGTWTSSVYTDATTGDLDFYYQVTNSATSADYPNRVSIKSFTGFTSSVAYLTSGGVAPNQADRLGSGDTIGFSFNNGISDGLSSDWLEINTNATAFTTGTMFIQDGGQASVGAYAPSSVPEPMSMSLLGSGLVGLGFLQLRRRSAKKA